MLQRLRAVSFFFLSTVARAMDFASGEGASREIRARYPKSVFVHYLICIISPPLRERDLRKQVPDVVSYEVYEWCI